jgi:hypothetical protein
VCERDRTEALKPPLNSQFLGNSKFDPETKRIMGLAFREANPAGVPFSQLPMEGYFFSRSPAPAVRTSSPLPCGLIEYSFSHSSRLNVLGTST